MLASRFALAAVLVARFGCDAAAWNPFEPPNFVEPSETCLDEFATKWLDPYEYAACIEEWFNDFSESPSEDERVAMAVASGIDGTPLITATLRECSEACYTLGVHPDILGARWLISTWADGSGRCICYGNASQAAADMLADSYGIRVEEKESLIHRTCVGYALLVPLSCLWTGEQPCTDAPGAPDGCLWTKTDCCVDAKGWTGRYNPFSDQWFDSWVYMAYSAVFLCPFFFVMCVAYLRIRLRPPREATRNKPVYCHESCLKKLKSTSFWMPVSTSETSDECVICLEDFAAGARVSRLPCGHLYHFDCLKKLLGHQKTVQHPSCPICRAPMEDGVLATPEGSLISSADEADMAREQQAVAEDLTPDNHRRNSDDVLVDVVDPLHAPDRDDILGSTTTDEANSPTDNELLARRTDSP
ncbi:E3 ubiquitin-protein ligase RING1-like [Diplonema papillatum]|nr:E3 ubiquitin-protein ligase RING1-like [Diplonema papillatum]KAJ9449893.1 E3 ubiquitin-protein ligase RING1-like [Diplonema papillatum]